MISREMMAEILCENFEKKLCRMRKYGFKKDLPALPSKFFMLILLSHRTVSSSFNLELICTGEIFKAKAQMQFQLGGIALFFSEQSLFDLFLIDSRFTLSAYLAKQNGFPGDVADQLGPFSL